jgi:hypothetical protein
VDETQIMPIASSSAFSTGIIEVTWNGQGIGILFFSCFDSSLNFPIAVANNKLDIPIFCDNILVSCPCRVKWRSNLQKITAPIYYNDISWHHSSIERGETGEINSKLKC